MENMLESLIKANQSSYLGHDYLHSFEKSLEAKFTETSDQTDKKFYGKFIKYIKEKRERISDSSDFINCFNMVEKIYSTSNNAIKRIIADEVTREDIKVEIKIGSISFSKRVFL